jgi:hypothetical protein
MYLVMDYTNHTSDSTQGCERLLACTNCFYQWLLWRETAFFCKLGVLNSHIQNHKPNWYNSSLSTYFFAKKLRPKVELTVANSELDNYEKRCNWQIIWWQIHGMTKRPIHWEPGTCAMVQHVHTYMPTSIIINPTMLVDVVADSGTGYKITTHLII